MVSARNRDVSRRKALRKRRLAEAIYRSWKNRNEEEAWEYYDNLHQYSKNKIHCSCPLCSAKTRNKGKRRKSHRENTSHYQKTNCTRFRQDRFRSPFHAQERNSAF